MTEALKWHIAGEIIDRNPKYPTVDEHYFAEEKEINMIEEASTEDRSSETGSDTANATNTQAKATATTSKIVDNTALHNTLLKIAIGLFGIGVAFLLVNHLS